MVVVGRVAAAVIVAVIVAVAVMKIGRRRAEQRVEGLQPRGEERTVLRVPRGRPKELSVQRRVVARGLAQERKQLVGRFPGLVRCRVVVGGSGRVLGVLGVLAVGVNGRRRGSGESSSATEIRNPELALVDHGSLHR